MQIELPTQAVIVAPSRIKARVASATTGKARVGRNYDSPAATAYRGAAGSGRFPLNCGRWHTQCASLFSAMVGHLGLDAIGRTPRKRAPWHFTLIELLVCIAIIGILASLLMPALRRAKEAAERALCLSNQKQQGVTIFTYAEDSDGRIPVHKGVEDVTLGYLNRPWKLEVAWNTNAPVGERGWGMLYEGLTVDPNVFYCPSQKDPKHATPSCYYQPWGSRSGGDPRPGTDSIRTGYFYKPYDEREPGEPVLKSIIQLEPDHMLSVDLVETFEKAAHGAYWQHLEGDGHAESTQLTELYEFLAGSDFNDASGWTNFKLFRRLILDAD